MIVLSRDSETGSIMESVIELIAHWEELLGSIFTKPGNVVRYFFGTHADITRQIEKTKILQFWKMKLNLHMFLMFITVVSK
jgi:hypothetical protein